MVSGACGCRTTPSPSWRRALGPTSRRPGTRTLSTSSTSSGVPGRVTVTTCQRGFRGLQDCKGFFVASGRGAPLIQPVNVEDPFARTGEGEDVRVLDGDAWPLGAGILWTALLALIGALLSVTGLGIVVTAGWRAVRRGWAGRRPGPP